MTRVTTGASAGEVCRLVVEGPTSRVDLSVPVGVPLCDLLPALLQHLGEDLADLGLEHGGWALQRLGEEPLDEDRTTAELGLRDGERLYLRPRSSLVPPLDFDDLVDGMASGARDRSSTWTPRHTTLAGHVLVVVTALLAVVGVLLDAAAPVPTLPTAPVLGGATAVLLGLAAVTHTRFPQQRTSRVYAWLGALTGALVPLSLLGLALSAWGLVGTVLWCGAVVAVATQTVRRRDLLVPIAVGTGLLALLLALAGLLSVVTPLPPTAIEVLLAAFVLLLRVGFPAAAFRMAGQQLPPLPRNTDDIQQDIDPAPGEEVVRAAARTEHLLTAMATAAGIVLVAVCGSLATGGTWSVLLACVLAANLVLSTRVLANLWQRTVWIAPAVAVVTVLVLRLGTGSSDGTTLLLALIGLLLIAAAAPLVARSVVRRPVDPRLGRWGDIFQTIFLVVAGPLAVLALEVSDYVRRVVS